MGEAAGAGVPAPRHHYLPRDAGRPVASVKGLTGWGWGVGIDQVTVKMTIHGFWRAEVIKTVLVSSEDPPASSASGYVLSRIACSGHSCGPGLCFPAGQLCFWNRSGLPRPAPQRPLHRLCDQVLVSWRPPQPPPATHGSALQAASLTPASGPLPGFPGLLAA